MFLTRMDSHMGLANSKALELAGISAATPDPEEGIIDRDLLGRPTGILRCTWGQGLGSRVGGLGPRGQGLSFRPWWTVWVSWPTLRL